METALSKNILHDAVRNSYVPIIFKNRPDYINNYKTIAVKTIEVQGSKIPNTQSRLLGQVITNNFAYQGPKVGGAVAGILGALIVSTIHILLYILAKRKRDEAINEYNQKIKEIDDCFCTFQINHKKFLNEIQASIDGINKIKPIIKDRLGKLAAKINSEQKDYPLEHLDHRKFDNSKEYDIISNQKLKIEELSKNICFELQDLLPIWAIVRNFKKAKTLKKKTAELERLLKSINPKMQADLEKLENLNEALKNVLNIFVDIKEIILPPFEDEVERLSTHYNNDIDAMPDSEQMFLFTVKDLFKSITEKQILNQDNVKDVEEYSDELSSLHSEIKVKYMDVA